MMLEEVEYSLLKENLIATTSTINVTKNKV